MLELLLIATFSSTIFFSILASVFGVLTRAALEKESAKFCLYHSLGISLVTGIYALFTVEGNISLSIGKYIGTFILFFMLGYVLSDIIESITFIISRRRK